MGSGSEELNGTYDMTGNSMEWLESPHHDPEYNYRSARTARGGYWKQQSDSLHAFDRHAYITPTQEYHHVGFRVASVPEPSTLNLLTMAAFGLAAIVWRQRRVL